MSLVLREIKGSKLTFAELDGNFTYLESLVGVTDVTYSELVAKITANELIEGALYKITDFKTCYDQPDFDSDGDEIMTGNYREATVQPIIVRAIATNKISDEAWQPDFPNDSIKYDVNFNETEVTGGTAYGRITERIDEFGNRTDYDHRTIKFKRYFSYGLDDKLSGWIYEVDGSSVYGVDTDFEADLNVDDIVFIPTPNSRGEGFYKVTSIISATEIEVEGYNYYSFYYNNEDRGVPIWKCVLDYENLAGTLYYFNDTGSNNINDGGNDMYDGGNYLNTNLASEIPYTHTQMSGVSGEATIPDFIIDGAVSTGLSPSVFGDSAAYFTNHYPGLFVMVATDCNIYEFYTSGNNGADGGGSVTEHTYSKTVGGNNYKAFIKRIGDGGFDPSINQIIIVNTDGTGITHSYSSNTNDGEQRVEGLNDNGVTQVHYLLTALAKGVRITNAEAEAIVDTYLGLIDGKNINDILTTLNTSYTDITDNLPARAVAANSYHYRQSNVLENTGYIEVGTFEQVNAVGNWIGDFAKYKETNGHTFLLANNVFGKTTDTSECYGNKFGDECYNNSFGGDCFYNEVVGGFSHNVIYYDFRENIVGYDCSDNTFLDDDCYRNRIGTDFYENIVTGQMWRNLIGNDFNNNIIIQDFQNNHIMNQFNNNKIIDDFYKNNIGNGANNNWFFRNVYGNTIGNGLNQNKVYANFNDNINISEYFNNNVIYSDFHGNNISTNFQNNTVGKSSEIEDYQFYKNVIGSLCKGNSFTGNFYMNQIGENFYGNLTSYDFRRNRIGTDFYFNTIEVEFQDNSIGNYFYSNSIESNFQQNMIANGFNNNTIKDFFAYNIIGNDFYANSIQNDFGFGGGVSRGNKIGNKFQNCSIGKYFYDNKIVDSFTDNTVGEYFQYNSVKNSVGLVNFAQNLGNILTVSYGSPSGVDNSYISLPSTTTGSGTGATFDITVAGGVVTSAIINVSGSKYAVSDTVTVAGSLFGGVDGVDDLTLTVLTISDTPAVYTTANCDIFRQSDGSLLLQTYETGVGLRFINPVDAL